jgi:lipopolysaccharide transport system permease protein
MRRSADIVEVRANNGQLSMAAVRAHRNSNQGDVTIIEPVSGWRLINVRELWKYRELCGSLVWRDVKVRYKQTLLGAAWAILQPLLLMIVFTIFFGRMAGVNSGGLPYPMFAFAGLLPWTFFSTAIANAGNSVVGSERLITKIYFPRLYIPFASVGAALVDFAIAFSMLIVLMIWYQIAPTAAMILIPVVMVLISLAALGVGTLLAALNVAYRDFRYVIPFLVQLWMFATPTIYMQPANFTSVPASAANRPDVLASLPESSAEDERVTDEGVVPADIQVFLNLNPLVGLIAFFRAATLGGPLPWAALGWSAIGAGLMFVGGCLYFRHVEDSFADII